MAEHGLSQHHSFSKYELWTGVRDAVAELAAARERLDCGGVNCGKCLECRTVNQWALEQQLVAARERERSLRWSLRWMATEWEKDADTTHTSQSDFLLDAIQSALTEGDRATAATEEQA